jgi:hypothetical protein
MRGSRPLTKPLVDRWCRHCERVAPSYATKKALICVECTRKYNHEWREKNREYLREYDQRRGKARARNLEYRQKVSAYRKKRRRTDQNYREREIAGNHVQKLKRYGLTPKNFDAMHAAQKGLCAICGEPSNAQRMGRKRALSIDHDHATGKVRALLCYHCNSGLGHFKDKIIVLWRAIWYLREHGKTWDWDG